MDAFNMDFVTLMAMVWMIILVMVILAIAVLLGGDDA